MYPTCMESTCAQLSYVAYCDLHTVCVCVLNIYTHT